MRTLIVDQDSALYHIAYANCKTTEWEPGVVSVENEDLPTAKKQVDIGIAKLKRKLGAERVILCLSCDQGNFRKAFFPKYKAQRTKPKPTLLKPLRDYCLATYETFLRPSLEADDCVGILGTHPEIVPGEKIMVSPDKDLLTIPGTLFNPMGPSEFPQETSQAEADYQHLRQTLIGDICDNYPGCPRVGPVKADLLLSPFWGRSEALPEAWAAMVKVFESKGLTEADAIVQARCARILRWTDYDYLTKQPILWEPLK